MIGIPKATGNAKKTFFLNLKFNVDYQRYRFFHISCQNYQQNWQKLSVFLENKVLSVNYHWYYISNKFDLK